MASFTAGTTFVDGVSNDVTAAKLGALVTNATPTSGFIQDRTAETIVATNDTLLIGDASDSNNLKRITVANFAQTLPTAKVTTGTIETGTFGTTTSTAQIVTSGTFLGTITGSTNVVNIGSGQIYKDASGNVGIGTTSPSDILHVRKADGVSIFESPGVSSVGLRLRTNSTDRWQIGCPSASGDLAIYTGAAATERLRINSSGNVGIGTASPSIASGLGLVINGGASQTRLAFKNTYTGDTSSDGVQFALLAASSSFIFQNRESDGSFAFETNSVERLRIDSSGNLLVGTTTDADHKICISHSHPASGSGGITINQIEAGTGRAIQFVFQTANQVGSITTTNSATAYNTSSDYRLKTNLEPISNGIERVKQLPVYRFNWIADEGGNKVDGFVAHEAKAIVPECVSGEKDAVDADGKPIHQGIDQSKIVPLLTAALKEAIAKIETLEAKVTALEAA